MERPAVVLDSSELTSDRQHEALEAMEPIREAPFSIEHLEEHARAIAVTHAVVPSHPQERRLWRRFEDNCQSLERAYEAIVETVQNGSDITPGAEWLLDNFYVVRDQLREIREDLPRRYFRELPKLGAGAFTGAPRVYALAMELIAHTDSSLDEATLVRFLKAYQQTAPLTMGEVWAVPIMLRLSLVENLRRLADRIVDTQRHRRCADAWADEIIDEQARNPLELLNERTKHVTHFASPLVAQMVQRFRDQGHDLSTCWHWLEQRLADTGGAIDEVVRIEHHRQASDQVSTGNAITSMRLITALDWSAVFEETSAVEQELRRDPAGVYARMDFATRDRYRHAIEKLSRRSRLTEIDLARQVIHYTRRYDGDPVRGHIGYCLIDEGRTEFAASVGVRSSLAVRGRAAISRHALAIYLSAIVTFASAVLVGLATYALSSGTGWGMVLLAVLVAILPASEIAVVVVNYMATRITRPRVLPKLDFRDGIPADYRTLVVMPTMLTSRQGVQSLVERLEIHYLANPDPQLVFALLLDFTDAPQRDMPEDKALVEEAAAGIQRLNARYSDGGERQFWLFHRTRQWNASEGKWMGWERKRGKLSELNRFLRGAADTSYIAPASRPDELAEIRYVITLDGDTQLPLGAARKLVGTIAHPLNRARVNDSRTLVDRGYAVLQPRIQISTLSAARSQFARIFSGNPHLDPYVTAVSDVYQDCFGEGSYTGKGIYDVDAFEAVVGETFPDNHILSHDLIESCHARTALVTDIEMIDDYPAQYPAYARRAHRWARGDWQLIPWLGPQVPTRHGRRDNPLSVLSRWKVFDNLRRSLVPPALMLMLALGWLLLPGSAALWTGFALLVLAMPLVIHAVSLVLAWPGAAAAKAHFREALGEIKIGVAQVVLAVAFLPHQAYLMVDAVVRTVARLTVSRRRLLEWETADATERRMRSDLRFYLVEMWPAPAGALLLGVLTKQAGGTAMLLGAAPLLVLWLAAPAIAFVVSRRKSHEPPQLNDEERRELRRLARTTWLFFERVVQAKGNWLPPDNYQEYPRRVVAYRTSPTNEGLFLVSALAAQDFGYLGVDQLATLLEHNQHAWSQLERFGGHPLNWYDTQTLEPLPPAYVSTVDSGNLAVCALTVRQGLLGLVDEPVFHARRIAGLADTLVLLPGTANTTTDKDQSPDANVLRVLDTLRGLEALPPDTLRSWNLLLDEMVTEVARILGDVDVSGRTPRVATATDELNARAARIHAVRKHVQEMRRDFDLLFPWVALASDARGTPLAALPPWTALWQQLDRSQTLATLARLADDAAAPLAAVEAAAEAAEWSPEVRSRAADLLQDLRIQISAGCDAAQTLSARLHRLAAGLRELAMAMDFTFLYDRQRSLFSIGFNVATAQLDRGHYDLLATEARLASFFAIGRGEVDHRHWFHLGRPLTSIRGKSCLLSWGGTMFEYLMPSLFLRAYPETLLEQSCQAAVDQQIEFGRQQGVPWGVSESAFAAIDGSMNYQYQSFGVPGLGLKRGLSKDRVVAPYATGLALMVRPRESLANLRALAEAGAAGDWGFYEALDYTPERAPRGPGRSVVRAYFAHHQGMLFTAINNCLFHNRMQTRFYGEPLTKAAELLLQERIPVTPPVEQPHGHEMAQATVVREADRTLSRWLTTPHTASPRTHLLSNGQYTVAISNAGTGYSSCHGMRLTRWKADTTCDPWGQFIYLRSPLQGELWSAAFQPVRRPADEYEVLFSLDKAEFHRRDDELETRLEIAVSTDNNAEVRLLSIVNHGVRACVLDVTSFSEIVLATAEAVAAHPAFQKLFVETEFVPEHAALVARRRPRAADEPARWAMHVIAVEDSAHTAAVSEVQYETDRVRFLGRGRTPAAPAACDPGVSLSGTTGAVLDPIFSLRTAVRVPAGQTARVAFSTALAKDRDEALSLADQYHDLRGVLRAFELAWAHAQVELRHVHLSAGKIHLFQRLASMLLYPDATLRAPAARLLANRQGQTALWRYGISGDFPIVLVHVTGTDQDGLVRDLLLAHEQWRTRDFTVELVILNDHQTSYSDAVQEQLQRLIGESNAWGSVSKRGGIFLLQGGRVTEEDRNLLFAAAHVALEGSAGPLDEQLDRAPPRARLPEALPASRQPPAIHGVSRFPTVRPEASDVLEKAWAPPNGIGQPSADGREYVIRLNAQAWPPAPWSNVIANRDFGCLVTEAGCGSTWADNSRENRLTPWSNDPVSDVPSEAIYVRDEETHEFWTPTPLPIRETSPYTIRHGQGYTRFEHDSHGIRQSLAISVASDAPVKFLRLKLQNTSSRRRRLSATYCAEWVLGVSREQTQLHVATEVDAATGALLAVNRFRAEFAERVAFIHVIAPQRTVAGDRHEFFGRNGSWSRPAALGRTALSGRTGAGLDPCGAVQTTLELAAGEEQEIVFLLGQAAGRDQVGALLSRFGAAQMAAAAADRAIESWNDTLEAIQVRTPNTELDVLVNRWLLYQTLSCRVWGRTAFYQSGGAYGFRDQLQDVMALVYARPDVAREQLLLAASHQFLEGDIQHWWHPPTGRGVRTRFSDDFLWLPYVALHYVATTGDADVLHVPASFLQSPLLEPGEDERYELPQVSDVRESLYEHCLRAIRHGLRLGPHDLPLMGSGDWNDGMNKVGHLGQGESVWVAWFQIDLLGRFAELAYARGDTSTASTLRQHVEQLRRAIEQFAWDGVWYRRAYFDDGVPLGSAANDACQIDSLSQSWAVIAGGDTPRARTAMQSVYERLVRHDDKLILLFTPPFDNTNLEPGYIKGYLPGVRENGGQYTHAAAWVVQAAALLGDGDRAMELFDLLNPLRHAEDPAAMRAYKVEPYVIAADVYSQPPHTGRGGWTWYTGSAAWMYRVAVEYLLGLKVRAAAFSVEPCIPAAWDQFELTLRRREATYRVIVENPRHVQRGVASVTCDGVDCPLREVPWTNHPECHEVRVVMG